MSFCHSFELCLAVSAAVVIVLNFVLPCQQPLSFFSIVSCHVFCHSFELLCLAMSAAIVILLSCASPYLLSCASPYLLNCVLSVNSHCHSFEVCLAISLELCLAMPAAIVILLNCVLPCQQLRPTADSPPQALDDATLGAARCAVTTTTVRPPPPLSHQILDSEVKISVRFALKIRTWSKCGCTHVDTATSVRPV